MTRPVALPLRGNVQYIQNGDLDTVRKQCANIVGVSSIARYIGGSIGVHIVADHVNVAQRIREATGTTLPAPEKRAEIASVPNDTQIVSKIAPTPLNGAQKGIVAFALRQLPPANRTLPAPAQPIALLPSGPIPLALADVKRELSSRHIALVDELDPNYVYFGYGDEVSALARVRRETCETTLLSLVGKTSSIHIVGVRTGYALEAAA